MFGVVWLTAVDEDGEVFSWVRRQAAVKWVCRRFQRQHTAGLVAMASRSHEVGSVRVPAGVVWCRCRRATTCGLVDDNGTEPQVEVVRAFDQRRRIGQALDLHLIHCINTLESFGTAPMPATCSRRTINLYVMMMMMMIVGGLA